MATIINGKEIAAKIEKSVRNRVDDLKRKGKVVRLDVILVGDNQASETYVKRKSEAADRVGIDFTLHRLPADVTARAIIKKIKDVQKKSSGLLIQLPLPEKLYTPDILNAIDPNVDVDCLTHENLGRLVMKSHFVAPPTPGAALAILKELNINLSGKDITIIGTGALVGKPLAIMLVNEGASVTTCNSRTKNLKEKCLSADIIVTGVGKKDIVRGDMVKPGAIVIDTGFVYENGKLMGDVNFDEVSKVAGHLTPTPGGVGPITVAQLLQNTIICAEKKFE
ncbi:MAG: bifunctional 5,10-methylenetetrahydrofolate dehydrogenase/5,10-methenyltetrahydrofolate cyclohydrolase [Patescibacteria group bacterium]|jgi:methylenetetrahydrofolate dehydrogenase (NADP+)/methenyltetrahydrofolate cyclohydrolase